MAISVLTDEPAFGALPDDLSVVRANVSVPVLRKDFLLTEYQIWEARAMGADAVLLIAAALSAETLSSLAGLALGLEMCPLVEVHSSAELKVALSVGAPSIGINNRDLHTFRVDLETTRLLRPLVPAGAAVVSEAASPLPSRPPSQPPGVWTPSWPARRWYAARTRPASSAPCSARRTQKEGWAGMTVVKICGLMDLEGALAALEAGADLLGFVFAAGRHQLRLEEAALLLRRCRDRVPVKDRSWQAVGVFANQSTEFVQQTARQVGLDLVQLSGSESADYGRSLGISFIRTLHMGGDGVGLESSQDGSGAWERGRLARDRRGPGRDASERSATPGLLTRRGDACVARAGESPHAPCGSSRRGTPSLSGGERGISAPAGLGVPWQVGRDGRDLRVGEDGRRGRGVHGRGRAYSRQRSACHIHPAPLGRRRQ